MIHIAWAGFYEGASDRAYFDVLLPRIMDEITRAEGLQAITVADVPTALVGRSGRTVESVAEEACALMDTIHVLFIHADTAGAARAATIGERSSAFCREVRRRYDWHPDRCTVLTPRHETEAWVLADPSAVTEALGYTGAPGALGLPLDGAAAEALPDPKAVLNAATRMVAGRRRRTDGSQLFTSVAQAQRLCALRHCESFRTFEARLRRALASLGCLAPA
jgi:hypothetical protein